MHFTQSTSYNVHVINGYYFNGYYLDKYFLIYFLMKLMIY